jgi:hypothetical protein
MGMSGERTVIGKKQVWTRKPYIPDEKMMIDFVGREKELKIIAAAWIADRQFQPLAPLLIGPPGCGKNRIVFEMAKQMGLDLYVCQGYENITAEELACSLMPSDEGNGKIEYLTSSLATAMWKGGICFIDEIGKFPGKALSLLASVLDDRRYIDLDMIGERIHAHPHFRFIAASNSEDLEGLPDFVRSRLFPVIRVNKPETALINRMICHQFATSQQSMEILLQSFWEQWDASSVDEEAPSPRDVLQIFTLAGKLADYERSGDKIQKNGRRQRSSKVAQKCLKENGGITQDHLHQALQQFKEIREMVVC